MFVESYQIVSYIMTCLDMFWELTCSFRSILLQSNLELNSFESCLLLFRPKSREGSECPPCPHNHNDSAYRDVHVHCISVEQNLPPSLSGVGFTNLSLPPSKKNVDQSSHVPIYSGGPAYRDVLVHYPNSTYVAVDKQPVSQAMGRLQNIWPFHKWLLLFLTSKTWRLAL